MSQSDEDKQARLKETVADAQAAAKALVKDAAALARQAGILKNLAARTRAEAQDTRAHVGQSYVPPSDHLRTIPEAARHLHVGERTLRHVLDDPDLKTRLLERTRKVGIFYKFVVLLPSDLISDLAVHLAARHPRNSPVPEPEGEEIDRPAGN